MNKINLNYKGSILLLFISLFVYSCKHGQTLQICERNGITNNISYVVIDTIVPRDAKNIEASNWSIGAEMMDRDYTIYKNWKDYLGKLGMKKARIQSGWAKTEKVKGVYDWEWLDEIIYDMAAQYVEPWVNLSYGNPIYVDGGGTLLNAHLPSSEESLNAWKNYVRAIVERYKEYVTDWEIWNEPNYKISAEDYANFLILTSTVIREVSSKANIIGFATGSDVDAKYIDKALSILKDRNSLDVIDEISYHRHIFIPEDREAEIELEKVMGKYGKRIKIRQGEAGCPSEFSTQFALKNYSWTEFSQSKHILRRLLTDLGHDKASCCFTIMDAKDTPKGWNRKGLLKSAEDMTVEYPKQAYYAIQHLTALFDNRIKRRLNFTYSAKKAEDCILAVYGYDRIEDQTSVVTIWKQGNIPTEDNKYVLSDFIFHCGRFTKPVYINMISGCVFEIPEEDWNEKNGEYHFKNIPVYDYPIVITDVSFVNKLVKR